MTDTAIPPARRSLTSASVPLDCWYAVGPSVDFGDWLTDRRAAGRALVLYRTPDGTPVVLADRCAHRGYPLSSGRLIDGQIHCGLCGFVYDRTGRCVSVPTQPRVPIGAAVASYPVTEVDGLVWAWFGEPGRAPLRRVPGLPWLTSSGWATVAGELDVDAGFLLLHESFADVTQVPVIAPEITPLVLQAEPPPLQVEVSETTVRLARTFPPAPLPPWQARALGVAADASYDHTQVGQFVSPAAWVDEWDVAPVGGGSPARMRFTHLVTPVDHRTTRLLWRVSRDFAVSDAAVSEALARMFETYYGRVVGAMETMQRVIDRDGPGAEVNVSSDLAALKVRSIVTSMLSGEV